MQYLMELFMLVLKVLREINKGFFSTAINVLGIIELGLRGGRQQVEPSVTQAPFICTPCAYFCSQHVLLQEAIRDGFTSSSTHSRRKSSDSNKKPDNSLTVGANANPTKVLVSRSVQTESSSTSEHEPTSSGSRNLHEVVAGLASLEKKVDKSDGKIINSQSKHKSRLPIRTLQSSPQKSSILDRKDTNNIRKRSLRCLTRPCVNKSSMMPCLNCVLQKPSQSSCDLSVAKISVPKQLGLKGQSQHKQKPKINLANGTLNVNQPLQEVKYELLTESSDSSSSAKTVRLLSPFEHKRPNSGDLLTIDAMKNVKSQDLELPRPDDFPERFCATISRTFESLIDPASRNGALNSNEVPEARNGHSSKVSCSDACNVDLTCIDQLMHQIKDLKVLISSKLQAKSKDLITFDSPPPGPSTRSENKSKNTDDIFRELSESYTKIGEIIQKPTSDMYRITWDDTYDFVHKSENAMGCRPKTRSEHSTKVTSDLDEASSNEENGNRDVKDLKTGEYRAEFNSTFDPVYNYDSNMDLADTESEDSYDFFLKQ